MVNKEQKDKIKGLGMRQRRYLGAALGARASLSVTLVVAGLVLVFSLSLSGHIARLVEENLVARQKQSVLSTLSEVKARLEGRLLETVALGEGLKFYVSDHTDIDEKTFDALGRNLLTVDNNLRSVGLAPNNVLSLVYPLAGNEKAVGVDYRRVPNQWAEVERAMLERQIVISGPLSLVQGGKAILVRVPIFAAVPAEQTSPKRPYWGVATLVVDVAKLLATSGLTEMQKTNQVQLAFGPNVQSTAGQHIAGHVFGTQDSPVKLMVDVPGSGGWELRAQPLTGWTTFGPEVRLSWIVGTAISLLIAGLAFLVGYEFFKVRALALIDPLTDLPNRRLLELRMRTSAQHGERAGRGFEIFFVDLDGFKPVNDTHGHGVGDQLLVEIGRKLRRFVSSKDTVARVGGDEFIILVPRSMTDAERKNYRDGLDAYLDDEIEVAGVTLPVRASIGQASYPEDAEHVDELRRIADARMYLEKTRKRMHATLRASKARRETSSGSEEAAKKAPSYAGAYI